MINFTPAARPLFKRRPAEYESWRGRADAVQAIQLAGLLKKGALTKYGQRYGLKADGNYDDFSHRVPLAPYEEIRADVMRMVEGEADVLWPGKCRRFAQSSGTSDGKSKFIPVTADSLRLNHYRGAADAVAHYLRLYPDSRIFSGKAFILGGSFANQLKHLPSGVKVGDLSANLIDNMNPLAGAFRVPSKQIALMDDWEKKLPALIEASARENITNISGVPSWFLTVLRGVLTHTGATSIHDVWPDLEVFFHGGIAFGPYREQYRQITDPSKMRYIETYNASEGFFAVQTERTPGAMQLILDAGCFYEFVPVDQAADSYPEAVTAGKVEQGHIYALVITSCNGLWRYPIGDTVKIESTDPLMISIAGRTHHFINAFGEELMVYNADAALERACRATGAEVSNYTAAPVYTTDRSRGRHQWLVEFNRMPEGGTEHFAEILDGFLQEENSDYEAKRVHDIFLDRLSITVASPGLFDRWLASTGKLGGQRKVPRLSNDRKFIDPMLEFNSTDK